jgi:ribonuclease Z
MARKRLAIGATIAALVAVAAGLAVAWFVMSPPSDAAILRLVKSRAAARAQAVKELDRTDAITCVLVGTGSPMPSDRVQACTAVFAGGQFLVFDCGDGAEHAMESFDLPVASLDAVFITHFHSDHFADLGEVIDRSWLLGRRKILPVHAPTGIPQILAGFSQAYQLEYGYRTAHHGEGVMPREFAAAEPHPFDASDNGEPIVVYDHEGVVVKAFAVNHPPVHPAVGYRIEHAGKVVVISGDTTTCESLVAQSADADLLCAEAMNMTMVEQLEAANKQLGNEMVAHIMHDIRSYHADVNELGKLAEQAKVKRLALTHLLPPVGAIAAMAIFKKPAAAAYHGEIIVGEDGTRIVVPLDKPKGQ